MSRIFIISNTCEGAIGGIETYVENEINFFLNQGYEVVAYYRIDSLSLLDKIRNLISWVKSNGIKSNDKIHLHDPRFTWMFWTMLILNLGRHTIFFSSHGFFFHHKKHQFIKRCYFKLLSILSNVFDVSIICSSKNDYSITSEYRWKKFVLFENPIEDVFVKVNLSQISPPYYRFVYWGRTSKNKNIELLLSVFNRLYNVDSNYHLTLVTSDHIVSFSYPWLSVIRNCSTSDLIEIVKDQQCFISLSNYEGFGLAIYEAYATGLLICCYPKLPVVKLLDFNYFPIYEFDEDYVFKSLCSELQNLVFVKSTRLIRSWNIAGFELLDVFGLQRHVIH